MGRFYSRRSIRLKGYDYSQEGMYFVTICTQNKDHLLGCVRHGEMFLNRAGRMVKKWWYKLESKYPHVGLGSFVVMPNHIHGIVNIRSPQSQPVGADPCVCPNTNNVVLGKSDGGDFVWDCCKGGHAGPPLQGVLQWYKTMTTNEYIRGVKRGIYRSFNGRFWHRNYYEHVIRNERSLFRIRQYIQQNPRKWKG